MRASETVSPDLEELVIKLRLSRVFVLRIWLGVRLLRLAVWMIGATVEVDRE